MLHEEEPFLTRPIRGRNIGCKELDFDGCMSAIHRYRHGVSDFARLVVVADDEKMTKGGFKLLSIGSSLLLLTAKETSNPRSTKSSTTHNPSLTGEDPPHTNFKDIYFIYSLFIDSLFFFFFVFLFL